MKLKLFGKNKKEEAKPVENTPKDAENTAANDLPQPPKPINSQPEEKPVVEQTEQSEKVDPPATPQQPVQTPEEPKTLESEPKKIVLPKELLEKDSGNVSKYQMHKEPIDPRDRFDDLIGNPNPIEEPKAEDFAPIKANNPQPEPESAIEAPIQEQKEENSNSFELPSAEDLKQLIKASEIKPNTEIQGLPSEETHEELVQPTETTTEVEDFALPEKFHQDIPNAEQNRADVPPSLDFKLYVSINDYAYAKKEMKKMHKFFAGVDKELEKWGDPENERLMAELFIDLNEAQEKIIQVDEKLFEGGL